MYLYEISVCTGRFFYIIILCCSLISCQFFIFYFFFQIIPEVSLNPVVYLGSYPNTDLYPPQVDLQLL